MYLKQISVFVENKPGAVAAPCRVLAEAGINMSALMLADTRDFGILRFITEDWEKAGKVLREKNFAIRISDVLAISVKDQPGALASVLGFLSEKSLNAEYMYAAFRAGTPVIIFRFDDKDNAEEILRNTQEYTILGPEQFFE